MNPSPATASGTRSGILDAAAEAFMRSGFANATIDEIARDVGATKGLIYYHFRSKFDIFLTVYEESMHRVRERVEPHTRGDGSGRERLIAMSIAHELNLMEDFAYHHVVHQAVRGEMSTALKARQRDALLALNKLRSDYERAKGSSRLNWEEAKGHARDAWHRVERAIPGDSDKDGR